MGDPKLARVASPPGGAAAHPARAQTAQRAAVWARCVHLARLALPLWRAFALAIVAHAAPAAVGWALRHRRLEFAVLAAKANGADAASIDASAVARAEVISRAGRTPRAVSARPALNAFAAARAADTVP